MRKLPIGYLLAVKFYAFHVDGLIRLTRCVDGQVVATRHMQYSMTEQRRADDVFCRAGIERIEAQRREDIPGRHLSAVVVTGIAAGCLVIECTAHLIHQLLSAPGLTGKVIKIDGMMTGFVAVGILTDKSAGIAIHLTAGSSKGKVLVELLDEALLTT